MNRRQRRAQQRNPTPSATPTPDQHAMQAMFEALTTRTECPDCNAGLTLVATTPGVVQMQVAHDDTCPTYRAMKETPQ